MNCRIAHFTDIHFTAHPRLIPWRALLSKRLIGWLNLRLFGRLRRLEEAERVTRAFVADLERVAPDHVLFTGDATSLSLPEEFRGARATLAPWLETGRITGLPGNHDVYVRSAVRESLYERHLGDWEPPEPPDGAPPRVRRVGEDAIICLRDARPTGWHDSSGCIGPEQLRRLREILASPDLGGRWRILALHYAPLVESGEPDSRLHGLRDAPALLDLLRRDDARVDLIVCGHVHRRFTLPASDRCPVPISTPGSLTFSAPTHARAYHVLSLADDGIRLEARRYDPAANIFTTWADAPGAGLVASPRFPTGLD